MSDTPTPPPTSSGPPVHPAPTETYRPISGLAVTAFILSLVSIIVAVGVWWVLALVPFILGVIVIATVDPATRRGRRLGVWAICISLFVGVLGFVQQQAMRQQVERMSGSILAALASDATDEAKDEALRPWFTKDALEHDVLTRIRKRFDDVSATHGSYTAPPDAGGPLSGTFSLMLPPDRSKYTELGADPKTKNAWPAPGGYFWATVRFEKGELRVGLELFGGQISLDGVSETAKDAGDGASPLAWVSNVRFFEAK